MYKLDQRWSTLSILLYSLVKENADRLLRLRFQRDDDVIMNSFRKDNTASRVVMKVQLLPPYVY